ncbi:hypothetical protein [Solidesulfovibrio alcoholivorans]|uniref:hypothetical protein n=1 Tax=Solidesulfovibrio alcoholivorans TaxID=81406 RepID=UPI0004977B38|nr:hypothetical protein [Solidesulfovibrio alcoholivorans]
MSASAPGLSPAARFAHDMAVLRQGGLSCAGKAPARPSPTPYRPRTGDVVLRLLALPESLGLASANLSGYSHCGVLHVRDGAPFVDDCYPLRGDRQGVMRRTPFSAWTASEAGAPVLHWLALRRPDMDEAMAGSVLDALAGRELRFSLILESHDALSEGGATANCSAFVRAFLEAMGVDCAPGVRAATVTTTVLTRFFFLARNGFYDAAPGNAGGDFYALAQAHGLTAFAACPHATLPPGFAELLPELVPAAYVQGADVPAATRRFALDAYARTAPTLRAALACHGLSPEAALAWLGRADARGLSPLVRALPRALPVHGADLAVGALLALAATPAPYVAIPLAVHFAFTRPGPLGELLQRALLRFAPRAAALARRARLGPFRLFDAMPEPEGKKP